MNNVLMQANSWEKIIAIPPQKTHNTCIITRDLAAKESCSTQNLERAFIFVMYVNKF